MSGLHLSPALLEPDAPLDDGARAHLDACPRCRVERRLLATFLEDDGADLPEFQAVGTVLDTLRSELTGSLVQGTLADLPATKSGPRDGGRVSRSADDVLGAALAIPDERYSIEGRLGKGGMGDVLRVLDQNLKRRVAMKVASPRFQDDATGLARFIEEAQVAAQLQHPGIVPVHELGRLPDGRVFFTMKEVDGVTFADALRAVHAASRSGVWKATADGWTFRKLIDAFRRVAETMGFAHAQGVTHRDLKPANLMLGAWGEVLVLDWGLAKVHGQGDGSELVTARVGEDSLQTRLGAVAGTPSYMAPEQARGDTDAIGPATDVYALGAILYALLTGRPPYLGRTAKEVVGAVLAGPPEPPGRTAGPLPDELVAACTRAMARRPEDRHSDAGALADEVGAWLEGAHRRERALDALELAVLQRPRASAARSEASQLRTRARVRLAPLRSFDSAEKKLVGWELEDEAAALDREAELADLQFVQAVRAALTHDPSLPEAHELLADHYRQRLWAAEALGDGAAVEQLALLVRAHDDGRHAEWLTGTGTLTLLTEPPGATVELLRWAETGRRLQAEPLVAAETSESAGLAGPLVTPLTDHPLAMGSYLIRLSAPGHARVDLPLRLRRAEQQRRTPPGSREPAPLRLPRASEVGPDDALVPAGWFWSGGDSRTPSSLPGRRVWVDDFVMKRHPVSHREYLEFLGDLVATGREGEALEHAQRERPTRPGELGALLVEHEAGVGFRLREDAEGDQWQLDWPVWMVSWHGARAYAAWLAARDGVGWRLPWELEWEKAARGVDGRAWPWGDFADPTWACVHGSREGRPMPAAIGEHPVDCSPYGVMGTGGNVCDWTLDVFTEEGSPLGPGGRFVPPPLREDERNLSRCVKGGSWSNPVVHGRGAFRDGRQSEDRRWVIGFRLARSFQARSS